MSFQNKLSDNSPFKAEDYEKFKSELAQKSKEFKVPEKKFLCDKCKDTGIVREKNGSVHTCWDCLRAGRLDVHSKHVKNSGIKI